MTHEAKLKLAQYIASMRHAKFAWGINDCNTFVLEMHDYIWNTDYLRDIKEKYSNRREAYRFTRIVKAQDKLETIGYSQGIRPVDGDVLLIKNRFYTTAYILLNNIAYSIQEDRGFYAVELKALDNYTIWRY